MLRRRAVSRWWMGRRLGEGRFDRWKKLLGHAGVSSFSLFFLKGGMSIQSVSVCRFYIQQIVRRRSLHQLREALSQAACLPAISRYKTHTCTYHFPSIHRSSHPSFSSLPVSIRSVHGQKRAASHHPISPPPLGPPPTPTSLRPCAGAAPRRRRRPRRPCPAACPPHAGRCS